MAANIFKSKKLHVLGGDLKAGLLSAERNLDQHADANDDVHRSEERGHTAHHVNYQLIRIVEEAQEHDRRDHER